MHLRLKNRNGKPVEIFLIKLFLSLIFFAGLVDVRHSISPCIFLKMECIRRNWSVCYCYDKLYLRNIQKARMHLLKPLIVFCGCLFLLHWIIFIIMLWTKRIIFHYLQHTSRINCCCSTHCTFYLQLSMHSNIKFLINFFYKLKESN